MDNDAELRTYFNFDDTDLNANRKGYLSRRQQARDKKDAAFHEDIFGDRWICFSGARFRPDSLSH